MYIHLLSIAHFSCIACMCIYPKTSVPIFLCTYMYTYNNKCKSCPICNTCTCTCFHYDYRVCTEITIVKAALQHIITLITFLVCRVQSRVCIINFEGPSIAPINEIQQNQFDELDDLMSSGDLSASCGWVVKQGRLLQDRQLLREMITAFRPHYSGRKANNWAMLALCVKEVCMHDIITSIFLTTCSMRNMYMYSLH